MTPLLETDLMLLARKHFDTAVQIRALVPFLTMKTTIILANYASKKY